MILSWHQCCHCMSWHKATSTDTITTIETKLGLVAQHWNSLNHSNHRGEFGSNKDANFVKQSTDSLSSNVPAMTMFASVSTLSCFHGPRWNSFSWSKISYVLTCLPLPSCISHTYTDSHTSIPVLPALVIRTVHYHYTDSHTSIPVLPRTLFRRQI